MSLQEKATIMDKVVKLQSCGRFFARLLPDSFEPILQHVMQYTICRPLETSA